MPDEVAKITSKIVILPGRSPAMLDRDVAAVYETTTKQTNRAVKRNQERFPTNFVFQLTDEEAGKLGFAVPDWHRKDGEPVADWTAKTMAGRKPVPFPLLTPARAATCWRWSSTRPLLSPGDLDHRSLHDVR